MRIEAHCGDGHGERPDQLAVEPCGAGHPADALGVFLVGFGNPVAPDLFQLGAQIALVDDGVLREAGAGTFGEIEVQLRLGQGGQNRLPPASEWSGFFCPRSMA